jgi:hypothetical protein
LFQLTIDASFWHYLSHMQYRIVYPVPTSSSGYAESAT